MIFHLFEILFMHFYWSTIMHMLYARHQLGTAGREVNMRDEDLHETYILIRISILRDDE